MYATIHICLICIFDDLQVHYICVTHPVVYTKLVVVQVLYSCKHSKRFASGSQKHITGSIIC